MGVFSITRKEFVDRNFGIDDMAELAEMLRLWYLASAGGVPTARQHVEAQIYVFPRQNGEAIQKSLSARLRDTIYDRSDPDVLRVIGAARKTGEPVDISVWQEVLSEQLVRQTCLMLRITFEGPMKGFTWSGEGTATFVLCGAPTTADMVVKAIWRVGRDESIQSVFKHRPWRYEQRLISAFDLFRRQSAARGRDSAAQLARATMAVEQLFIAWRDEWKDMWLLRWRAELPYSRGPAAFMGRICPPLLGCLSFVAIAFLRGGQSMISAICIVGAIILFLMTTQIAMQKLWRIRQFYVRMRRSLGAINSAPNEYEEVDLSDDKTPTLLKCSAEAEASGAQHVCDIRIKTARGVLDSNRVYAIGDTMLQTALAQGTENITFFPPHQIIVACTRFKDGRRHYSVNRASYRGGSQPNVSGRCLVNDEGIAEVLAFHRRHVDNLIAAGAVPLAPPDTSSEVIELMRQEHEEGRQLWQTWPYTWGDALHQAFNVCRREYLAD